MRVVVDTNVVVSAAFFGGQPQGILDAWRDGRIEIAVSEAILAEYEAVLRRIAERYPPINPEPVLRLLFSKTRLVQPARVDPTVCADPHDLKFIEAALGGAAQIIVSGDRHLLAVTGIPGVTVLRPAEFVDRLRGAG
ncbi:MAG: putative toxin-antitoxin system toxin component, PIN family [Candidatus Dadabacteria bacterium]|nr:MAG: putative toxin-antitoxin system toxin component, PIN family [Candidatus Dadabacteria bacterium]